MRYFAGILGAGFFLVVGILSLFWPQRMRDWWLENYRQGIASVKRYDLSFLLKAVPGIWLIRLYGLIAIASAALIILGLTGLIKGG